MYISKEGDRYLRTLMVQGAQHILGQFGKDADLSGVAMDHHYKQFSSTLVSP